MKKHRLSSTFENAIFRTDSYEGALRRASVAGVGNMRQTFRHSDPDTLWSAVGAATYALDGRAFSAAPQGRLLARRAAPRLRQIRDTLRLWQDRVRGRHQLRELDDHVLRDIGITRLQAEAEANKPFWRA
jgi:uncharacterized protein YjiS (DUF1127 family)